MLPITYLDYLELRSVRHGSVIGRWYCWSSICNFATTVRKLGLVRTYRPVRALHVIRYVVWSHTFSYKRFIE